MNRERDAPFWRRLHELAQADLGSEARAWAGRAWLRRAQMEHASIASFSKLSLQLTAVGAPPGLLLRCHEAAIDEVHHARISLAVASTLLGAPHGPGRLDVSGHILEDCRLITVVAETVIDGCVGESVAAAEAAVAGNAASLEVIARAMEVIAADEQLHAELAWEIVAWAAQVGGPELGCGIQDAFDRALAHLDEAPVPETTPFFDGLGHLRPADARQVVQRTVADVILPARDALGQVIRAATADSQGATMTTSFRCDCGGSR